MTKENNEDDYCVYFAILGDYYYVCPEKTTLDDCCFKGTNDECYKWIEEHENLKSIKT
jgi:hypothetical protein